MGAVLLIRGCQSHIQAFVKPFPRETIIHGLVLDLVACGLGPRVVNVRLGGAQLPSAAVTARSNYGYYLTSIA